MLQHRHVKSVGRWLLAAGLLTGAARADPSLVRRDPLAGSGQLVQVAGAQLALTQARSIAADPFQLQPTPLVPWSANGLGAGARGPLFYPSFTPQLTLRFPPVWGLQPLVTSRAWGLVGGRPRLDSDFGLSYTLGRFHTGMQVQLLRRGGELSLNSLAFVRYVAPTFHVGAQDSAIWPLTAASSSTHAVSVSAGFRRAPQAPALRVSSTLSPHSQSSRFAGALFAAF
ncbi:MAG: hypothetical protein ABUL60_06415 [Myxococcales bacterium]